MSNKHLENRLVFPMQRGPYQNNGASPWYCTLKLGTPGQPLKFAIDSGTNMNWITSAFCPANQCVHSAGGRFDAQSSSTFAFTDCLQRPYSFGPWGTLQVESASDVLTMPCGTPLETQLLLATAYDGEQFKQLDWDGGLGLPCSSAYVEGRSSFLLQALMRDGQLSPAHLFVAFDWDNQARNGTCQMGGVDPTKTQGPHLFLAWSVYSTLAGVEYIWSADLKSYSVGSELMASNLKFALDSGSSQFKGDDGLMRRTLARIAQGGEPDIVLGFADGEITLGANLYNCLIEEGPQKGERLPQFAPLGLADLVLVGSLVMEHCYTVYEYQVVKCSHEVYSLAPVGMWLFNRADGPQIITRSSSTYFTPGARSIPNGKLALPGPSIETVSIAGTWKNDYGSVMNLAVSGQHIYGTYHSSTGSTGKYSVSGISLGAGPNREKNQPIALAINWRDLGAEPCDPSWNWTSGLSGQLSVTTTGEALTLSHLLVATSEFPELAGPGTYVDKLVYRRVEKQLCLEPPSPSTLLPVANALAGSWIAGDGTSLVLSVHGDSTQRIGIVRGRLTCPSSGADSEVRGFTDINAVASKLPRQSVSLTAAEAADAKVRTLCGTLQLAEDVLDLLVLASASVAPANAYLATQISSIRFTRAT